MKTFKTALQSSVLMLGILSLSAAGLYSCSESADPKPSLGNENEKVKSPIESEKPDEIVKCLFNASIFTTSGGVPIGREIQVWNHGYCPVSMSPNWNPTSWYQSMGGYYHASTELLAPGVSTCTAGRFAFRQGSTYYVRIAGTGSSEQIVKVVISSSAEGLCLEYDDQLNVWQNCRPNVPGISISNVTSVGCTWAD